MEADRRQRRHLSGQLCRLVPVRDEAYYAEDETVLGEDHVRRGSQSTPVEWVEEKSYFFVVAYQDKLLALYALSRISRPHSRRNEASFVKSGLRDFDCDHIRLGRQGPDDPEHVMWASGSTP